MILAAVLLALAIAVGVIAYLLWQLDTANAALTEKTNASNRSPIPGARPRRSTKGV